ncbi:hypothetical protein NC652_007620 [Populus alba x Populus x berolinensis]|nr:hypothetical protein NC652_007615 [Populus alba x Populus x berolinensis]KAJ6956601.1 hypothetical protein NC652_007620 [Populus alba x Populus x berolinensis]
MGKQSSLEEEQNNFTRAKERRANEVAFNAMEEVNSFFQPEERTSLEAGACGAKMDMGLERQIYGQMILVGGFGEDLHVGNNMGFWSVGEKCLIKCSIGM